MGNEITTASKYYELSNKLDDPATRSRLEKEFKKGGSYHNYLLTKLQAEYTCSSPFISISQHHQDECVELQIKAMTMKIDAYNKTEGLAQFLEEFNK